MNYGFLPTEITEEHYVLGGLGVEKKVLNPTREWRPFLPLGEVQRRTIETSSCTEFGSLNGIETLEKKLFGKTENYSERLLAIGAGNTEQGNDPHTVLEYIRHYGLANEKVLPFTDEIKSFEEYLNPRPLTRNYEQVMAKWLKRRDFKHEWVFDKSASLEEKQSKLLESLTYSPLGISVAAWHKDGDLYVKADNEPDNHWTLLVGCKPNEQWIVYDSYLDDGEYIKHLDWHYSFQFAKLFILNQKTPQTFWLFWQSYFGELFR